jgi:uncharacterized protein
MDLSFQAPGEHHFIHSVSAEGIRVGERTYTQSLVISADQIRTDWPVQNFEDFESSHFELLFQLEPDLVLLGTGANQHFLSAELMMEFYQRGIGIEIMNTAAACRTFNVLVAESRRVVAALLPPSKT